MLKDVAPPRTIEETKGRVGPIKRAKEPYINVREREKIAKVKAKERKANLAASQKLARKKAKVVRRENQLLRARDQVVSTKHALKEIKDALEGRDSKLIVEETLDLLPPTLREHVIEQGRMVYAPNPGPQTEFLAASEKEVFYGGARGGGKSYAMLLDPLRYCSYPRASALLIRRTMNELRDLIEESRKIYPEVFPGAKFREQEKEWRFPSGARIKFGYADSAADAYQYQGHSYSWIGVDELPQYPTSDIWSDLKGALRSVDPNVPTFMRACVDTGDVLTESGWKDIYEVKKGELVYSFNIETEKLELKPVTETYVYDIDEDIVKIRGKGKYMSFTKDHKVLWRNDPSYPYKVSAFNEIKNKRFNLCRAGKFSGSGYQGETLNLATNQYMWFLGLFLSEGCTTTRNRTVVTQVKEEEAKIVHSFLYGLRPDWKYYKNGDFTIHDKGWHAHLSQFGKAKEKFIPREILNTATEDQLRLLFDALMFGDGNWQDETCGTYYTISKQLVDDISELGLKLGYKVWAKSRIRPLSTNKQYEVYFAGRQNHSVTTRKQVSYEPHKGKIACISVADNGTFVIRQREAPEAPECIWVSHNTGNPGNIGSTWVREMFIDPAPAGEAFSVKIDTMLGTKQVTRRFIKAKLTDNPKLMQTDEYIIMLSQLPEYRRRQWLEGDWDVYDGAAFPEFSREIHVVQPFDIPQSWPRFRSCDWGYSAPACCLWFAVDPDGDLIVYRELYVTRMTADVFAQKVLALEHNDPPNMRGILDSSTWARRGDVGPSIAETMIRSGCSWRPSDRSPGSRINGKLEIHRRLAVDLETEKPRVVIFSNCDNLIRTMPQLPTDSNNTEDVDTHAEDHAYDAFRYGCMSRPISKHQFEDINKFMKEQEYQPACHTFGY